MPMRAEVSRWQPPPERPQLSPGTLHLWRFDLDQIDTAASRTTTILTSAEQERARRLRDPLKQQRFRAARTTLRRILSRYLNTLPAEIDFDYSRAGKPGLSSIGVEPLHFNLAHSQQQAVLGLTRNSSGIGIDLEHIDPQLDYAAIAARFFSPTQEHQLAAYPPQRQRRGFYRFWTQLEASLKHSGTGLSAHPQPVSGLAKIPTFLAPAFVCTIALQERPQSIQRFTYQSFPD
jgi:4'-phosphopantetheinyl transferase